MSEPRIGSSQRRKYYQPRNIGNIYKPWRKSEKYRLRQEVNFAYQITKNLNNKPSTVIQVTVKQKLLSLPHGRIHWSSFSGKQFAWKTFIPCSFMQKSNNNKIKYRKDNKKTKLIGCQKGIKKGKGKEIVEKRRNDTFLNIYNFHIGLSFRNIIMLYIYPQINE